MPLWQSLYKVAYYVLESEDDAMDAVQDLYVRLWDSRDSLDAVSNPKAYCITLIRNLCIDKIRKSVRRPTVGLIPETAPDESDVFRTITDRETLARLAKAVEKLPEGQRNVLKMRTIDELSYEEISAKTGMNQLTLRVLLSQARKKLKGLL